MAIDPELAEHIQRLEAELVSPEVWQSRPELETRMSPDFVEINSEGLLHREDLISIILGADPGVWRTEDFTARELAPTVVLVTYRHLIENDDGGVPTIALRSSIWRRDDGAWRMVHHQSTRVLDSDE
ncbi:MAG TPA: DUF4440 domain-containing protein [Acidimicrobiia bacterium]